MAEMTNDLRTTTISLDEYNALKLEADRLKGLNGGQSATIAILNDRIAELRQKQPEVKVIHGVKEIHFNEYDGDCSNYEDFIPKKVEFINLTEVERLAENKVNEELKSKLNTLESDNDHLKDNLKRAEVRYDELTDTVNKKTRLLKKMETEYSETLEDKHQEKDKLINKLKKAVDKDTKQYEEIIKDLKEEIQKIKDNKTDLEIEKKRNKEIIDLKGRIKDLEKLIEELGSMNFFKRVFKLRTISAEKLAAQQELLEREKNANAVGKTWVKEGDKYRKYNAFEEMWGSLKRHTNNIQDYFYGAFNPRNVYNVTTDTVGNSLW